MKTLMTTLLTVVSLGLFTVSTSAKQQLSLSMEMPQDTIKRDTVKKDTVKAGIYLAQNEVTYTKVSNDELPQTVKSAILAKFSASTIDEVFKGSDNSYKVIVKNGEIKTTVYYTEGGDFIKKETSNLQRFVVIV